ncbi:putative steryl acetyl hydrolase mug81 [Cyberlindnera fabianii]|nr:putative steryl acetyl hydrolase mug81 [Cyberlindnera fabianii]
MHPTIAAIFTRTITAVIRNIPLDFLRTIAPRLSLSLNIILTLRYWSISIPNANTPVPNCPEATIRWLTEVPERTKEDQVIIFCHGGGYVFGLFPPFVSMLLVLYESLTRSSIIIVDYCVTDEYPTQLRELVQVYNEVKKSSDNIVLMGDSAGGHLVLSLLRHAEHPLTSVDTVVIDNELKGLILLSPWVNLWPEESPGSSYEQFKKCDLINATVSRGMAKHFYKGENFDAVNPITWERTKLPKKIMISYGIRECMKDDIVTFAKNWGVDPVIDSEHGIHDSACFWPLPLMRQVADVLNRDSLTTMHKS